MNNKDTGIGNEQTVKKRSRILSSRCALFQTPLEDTLLKHQIKRQKVKFSRAALRSFFAEIPVAPLKHSKRKKETNKERKRVPFFFSSTNMYPFRISLVVVVIFFGAFLCLADASTSNQSSTTNTTKHLLLVGNSYTHRNNMPMILQGLLNEVDPTISVQTYSPGGRNLSRTYSKAVDESQNSPIRELLETIKWNWVVLQEQSILPGLWQDAVEAFAKSEEAVVNLQRLLLQHYEKTQIVLYETWGRRDLSAWEGNEDADFFEAIYPSFVVMNDKVRQGYDRYRWALRQDLNYSDDHKPLLAPVGRAFRFVYDNLVHQNINPYTGHSDDFVGLYDADSSHPSLAGSYLAACLLYGTILGPKHDTRYAQYVPEGLEASSASFLRAVANAALDIQRQVDLGYGPTGLDMVEPSLAPISAPASAAPASQAPVQAPVKPVLLQPLSTAPSLARTLRPMGSVVAIEKGEAPVRVSTSAGATVTGFGWLGLLLGTSLSVRCYAYFLSITFTAIMVGTKCI